LAHSASMTNDLLSIIDLFQKSGPAHFEKKKTNWLIWSKIPLMAYSLVRPTPFLRLDLP
jgi:hypothetical protein